MLLVQPGSSLHFPAVEHLRDCVCSRALAGTGLLACPGDTAVTTCITSVRVASAAYPQAVRVHAVPAQLSHPCQPLALRAVSPGLVISGLVRDMTLCSSSSISTTLCGPGLLPRQQR